MPRIFISSDDQIRPSHEAVVDVDVEAAAALPSGDTQSAYVFDTVFDAHCFNEMGTIPERNTEGLDKSHNNLSQALNSSAAQCGLWALIFRAGALYSVGSTTTRYNDFGHDGASNNCTNFAAGVYGLHGPLLLWGNTSDTSNATSQSSSYGVSTGTTMIASQNAYMADGTPLNEQLQFSQASDDFGQYFKSPKGRSILPLHPSARQNLGFTPPERRSMDIGDPRLMVAIHAHSASSGIPRDSPPEDQKQY